MREIKIYFISIVVLLLLVVTFEKLVFLIRIFQDIYNIFSLPSLDDKSSLCVSL